jgi:hypothetical protein
LRKQQNGDGAKNREKALHHFTEAILHGVRIARRPAPGNHVSGKLAFTEEIAEQQGADGEGGSGNEKAVWPGIDSLEYAEYL